MFALLMISMQAGADDLGQALAAELDRMLKALASRLRRIGGYASLKPGVVVTLPSCHDDGFLSPTAVQRRDHALVEPGAFLQHRLRGFEAGFLEARAAARRRRCSRVP